MNCTNMKAITYRTDLGVTLTDIMRSVVLFRQQNRSARIISVAGVPAEVVLREAASDRRCACGCQPLYGETIHL